MKKFLIGGIVAGILYFLLGYLFFGNLLAQYFIDHPGATVGIDRAMDHFQWWALILGNFASGFLLAYVFAKAGVSTLLSGFITGGIIGLLMSSSYNLVMYATTNVTSKHAMAAHVGAFVIISAIVGAVVGAIMGLGNKTATA